MDELQNDSFPTHNRFNEGKSSEHELKKELWRIKGESMKLQHVSFLVPNDISSKLLQSTR